jgi:hypothetical protein
VGLLLNEHYDAVAIAPAIKVPALFILAERDDITPVANGSALERAWGGPKQTVTLADARHYGIERRADFWSAVAVFLRGIDSGSPRMNGQTAKVESPLQRPPGSRRPEPPVMESGVTNAR